TASGQDVRGGTKASGQTEAAGLASGGGAAGKSGGRSAAGQASSQDSSSTGSASSAEASNRLPDQMGTPQALRTIQSIRADKDHDLIAHLNDVKKRGSVLSVLITLSLDGNKKESEYYTINEANSRIMDYESGESYPLMTA